MNDFKGRHFNGEVVLWAVRWYCRYGISYRDLETMMAERGVRVDHSTIYRWVQKYAPEMERRMRWQWRVDETYIKVRGKWTYGVARGLAHDVRRPIRNDPCPCGSKRPRTCGHWPNVGICTGRRGARKIRPKGLKRRHSRCRHICCGAAKGGLSNRAQRQSWRLCGLEQARHSLRQGHSRNKA